MPASDVYKRFPLRLCEVLEQEFSALHGQREDWPDWRLRPGDVEPAKLVRYVRSATVDAKENPVRVVCDRLRKEQNLSLDGNALGQQDVKNRLHDALNALLRHPESLYPQSLLSPESEAYRLSQLHRWPDGKDPQPFCSEHVQLNRLLLEAAFPADVIARVDNVRQDFLFLQVHALPEAAPLSPVAPELPPGPPATAREAAAPPPREPHEPVQPQLQQQQQAGPVQADDGPKPLLRSALCLSGGGIRSAAFALGGVQALAGHHVLDKFDYLSTVSGGGYLGSWLSTWIHRHRKHVHGVSEALRDSIRHRGGPWESKLMPEAEPVRFLRTYSHFLNARAGLFSLDTWTWVGLYLRNLSLNWLVLIPLLMLLLMLPHLFASVAQAMPQPAAAAIGRPVLVAVAAVAGVLTVLCAIVNRPSASDTARRVQLTPDVLPAAETRSEKLLRLFKQPAWILALGIVPLVVFATALAWLLWDRKASLPGPQAMLIWGTGVIFAAWLLSLFLLRHRPWRERAYSLIAMMLAGLLTWFLLRQFAPVLTEWVPRNGKVLASMQALHFYTVLGAPAVVLAVLAGMTLFIGVVSKWKWVEDEDREWWARFGAWSLLSAVGWIALAAVAGIGPALLLGEKEWLSALGGISGLAGVLLGKSAISSAGPKDPAAGKGEGTLSLLRKLAGGHMTTLLAAVFLVWFLALLSLFNSALLLGLHPSGAASAEECQILNDKPWQAPLQDASVHAAVMPCTPWPRVLLAALILGAVAGVAGLAINLNKFSLHAAYRIRIARTFLGASRGKDRRPNPFTGFDPMDNVQMHELQPGLLREADLADASRLVDWLRTALQETDKSLPAGASSLKELILNHPSPQPPAAGADDEAAKAKAAKAAAAVCELATLVCSREHDLKRRLRQDLLASKDPGTVLASVVQLLLESLNRVLESRDLVKIPAFAAFKPPPHDARSRHFGEYLQRGQRIFANRLLLERIFGSDQMLEFAFPPPPPHKLMHVVNLTLNLVRGRNLAWQERKAAPFTVSPMHSGNYYLGYRASRDYGAGISIATAAAVSGAAVSPNMGYSSSPVTALLLTLFNVRLGWWLGNPGTAGGHNSSRKPWLHKLRERVSKRLPPPYCRKEPFFSLHPVISEALGNTDDSSHYVYLSDGGHFENLGLYEMVLRRCHFIVVFDAGADPEYQFDDLGNAVRKIRIDLGIPIEVEPMPIRKAKDADDRSGRYCALGCIRYSQVDGVDAPDGLLLYFKPVLRGTEPRDVQHYVARNRDFPQESTSDQFFGEAQFESYRSLGQWAVEQALSDYQPRKAGWAAELAQRAHAHIHDQGAFRRKPKLAPWLAQWQSRFKHCE